MMQEANHVFELNVRLFSSFEPLVEATPPAEPPAVFIVDESPGSTRTSTPRDTPSRIAIIPNPFAALVGPMTPAEPTMVVKLQPKPATAWRGPAIVVAGAALAVGVALLVRPSFV